MAALDAADAAVAEAVAVAAYDPKAAAGLLRRSIALRSTGRADGAGSMPAAESAVAEWEAAHGGPISDPAVREKVYRAVAESRRVEAEAAERAAREKAAAAAGARKLGRRRRRN